MKYESPEMELRMFDERSVIVTSLTGNQSGDDNEDTDYGGFF